MVFCACAYAPISTYYRRIFERTHCIIHRKCVEEDFVLFTDKNCLSATASILVICVLCTTAIPFSRLWSPVGRPRQFTATSRAVGSTWQWKLPKERRKSEPGWRKTTSSLSGVEGKSVLVNLAQQSPLVTSSFWAGLDSFPQCGAGPVAAREDQR